jgi:hypothetical protein
MKNLVGFGFALIFTAVAALGFYELTAKSPALLGQPLPGWQKTNRIEQLTDWQQPTGFLLVDKLLHEGEEAARFYGML